MGRKRFSLKFFSGFQLRITRVPYSKEYARRQKGLCHRIFTKRAGVKASDIRAFRVLKFPNKPFWGDSKATPAGNVAAYCGQLLSPWKKRERRDMSLAVLAVVYARLDDAVL